ncbi:MAG: hypothetical protein HQK54_11835, partial [Oligoflexales bacterium]|nr:hypothetical protein [Oligoflexales bacterium]
TLKVDIEANQFGGYNDEGAPKVGKRTSSQIVTVKNGQTAVISGLVSTSESETYQKIPFLGDIPILGWLFRNSQIKKETTSLMIFITPHIVYGANDLASIYEKKVQERNELIKKGFGDIKHDPFMEKLPDEKAGQYHEDSYDRMEKKDEKDFLKELRKDMGYTQEEVDNMERQEEAKNAVPIKPDSKDAKPPSPDGTAPNDGADKKKKSNPGDSSGFGRGPEGTGGDSLINDSAPSEPPPAPAALQPPSAGPEPEPPMMPAEAPPPPPPADVPPPPPADLPGEPMPAPPSGY